MLLFGNMLKEAGIKRIFNAAVTHDTAHPSVSRLLTAVSEIMEIETETFCTPHYDEAFNFIKTKVEKFAGYA
ncbi:MAG: hypothetical protein EP348_03705 [Alphaproteobacteria bacterium]|nr:MAG: hypothetical protein EP348_03705 [Alphaproteobacteria bacterium]